MKSAPAKPAKPRRRAPPKSGHWLLQDAKARFSELVRRVCSEGPQRVIVHSREEVVVISAEEFRRLKGDPTGKSLIAAMRASPHRDIDIEPKRTPSEMSNHKKVTASSGNVFADLGFGNPEEELLKAKLVREIRGIIKRRKLTQTKAAAMLGLKQPDVSALVTGRVGKFSIDRLVRCLDRMDYKVDVVVRHKPRRASSRAIAA